MKIKVKKYTTRRVRKEGLGRPLVWPWDTMMPGECFDTLSTTRGTASNGNRYAKRNNRKVKFLESLDPKTSTIWVYCWAK